MTTDLLKKINDIAKDFGLAHIVKNKSIDDIYELFMNDLLQIDTLDFDLDSVNDNTLKDLIKTQIGYLMLTIKPETIDDIILMIRQYNELK